MRSVALGAGAEFDLIRRFLAAGAESGEGGPTANQLLVGPGDDCAVLAGGLVVGADLAVEGVHFRRDWLSPKEIGYRAAAASLSDLAAMAAQPLGILVALAVPPEDVPEPATEIMAGARTAAWEAGAMLLGGDLTASPGPLVLDVVVLGRAEPPVLRAGARPGDELWVTGELGTAAAAVRAWRRGRPPPPAARLAFARPRPRIREARWLAQQGVLHALIDLSDGLAGDAAHMAAAGGVAIVLDPEVLPVSACLSEEVSAAQEIWELALGGGEDYELCFAAPAGRVAPLVGEFEREFGVRLSAVGEVRAGSGVVVPGKEGRTEPLRVKGFRHFEGAAE
ncbi:MAG: thiamine-phosphate kinase [Gemmatimonadetes bacterium]|nr:thiamine-phosphate kinase [Gemmatimonadota bacterium]